MTTQFVVEGAGCPSCGRLLRDALSALGSVESVDVDEAADAATVRLAAGTALAADDVDRILSAAAEGSGHAYRVRPGSWRVERTP